jgi:hypothetical protein
MGRGQIPRLARRRFDISLAETAGLLPKRFQLSPHEFHLNSKHVLNIPSVAQVPNKLLGGGNVLLRIGFHFLAEFGPPEGAARRSFSDDRSSNPSPSTHAPSFACQLRLTHHLASFRSS